MDKENVILLRNVTLNGINKVEGDVVEIPSWLKKEWVAMGIAQVVDDTESEDNGNDEEIGNDVAENVGDENGEDNQPATSGTNRGRRGKSIS